MVRARRVAAWLRSPELHDHVNGAQVILVLHGAFIDLLLKALLGTAEQTQGPAAGLYFDFENLSTGMIHVSVEGKVRVDYLNRREHLKLMENDNCESPSKKRKLRE